MAEQQQKIPCGDQTLEVVADAESSWEKADDPVKNGDDGEEEQRTKCQRERTTAEAERMSYFNRKQGDDRRTAVG